AREGDLVHVTVLYQRFADDAALAGDNVEYTGRQTRLQEKLSDTEHAQGCQLRRFDHDRASACKRRSNLPHADHHRKVPWNDCSNYTDRLAYGIGQRIGPRGND